MGDSQNMHQVKHGRLLRALAICILMSFYIAAAWWSMAHMDLSRDMRTALEIREGREFPMLGPIMGGHINLGPVWYYLLALLQALSGSWLGTMCLLSALASLQFPLAYLAGKCWHSRSAGLLWSFSLIVPSWSTFEQIFPTHTQLTGALVAAFILFAIRYYRFGKLRDLLALFGAFSLALHAHPSVLALSPITIAVLYLEWHRHKINLQRFFLSLFAFLIPFSPFLLFQALNGLSLGDDITSYLASGNMHEALLSNSLPLAWQATGGGLYYWLKGMLEMPSSNAILIVTIWFSYIILGLAGLAIKSLTNDVISRFSLFFLPIALLSLSLMRGFFPYYMTTAVHVVVLGLASVGFSHITHYYKSHIIVLRVIGVGFLSCYLYILSYISAWEKIGNWPFSFVPRFNVIAAWQPHTLGAIMPAYGMTASGEWLCRHPNEPIHGAYAVHLIHSFAMERRMTCQGTSKVVIGSSDPSLNHWLGLPRHMFQSIDRQWKHTAGIFGIIDVKRIIYSPNRLQPEEGKFPPFAPIAGSPVTTVISANLREGESIAITNLGFAFINDPSVRVYQDGTEITPASADRTTKIYKCTDCSNPLNIHFNSQEPNLIDIVII